MPATGCDERLEDVGLELLANPPLVQLLEGEEEACACELRDPDGVGWVDLVARDNPEFTPKRYGRGGEQRVAYAGMRRSIVEQAE